MICMYTTEIQSIYFDRTYKPIGSSIWDTANGADSDQTPQNKATDQGHYCFINTTTIGKNEKFLSA